MDTVLMRTNLLPPEPAKRHDGSPSTASQPEMNQEHENPTKEPAKSVLKKPPPPGDKAGEAGAERATATRRQSRPTTDG
ncbi:hypothetical protein F2Q70_00019330 [Brassica cretica]|uniref:Uncharacterized protein n=1 Tax=Brassica cretica TaxID=69181 RepID=A0A8S9GUF7_BRACR|nr:hypothetical protein F2Q70_00019330 [Brassica cretica]